MTWFCLNFFQAPANLYPIDVKPKRMHGYTVSLYHQFQRDLAQCGYGRKGFERRVETCFQIAYQYIVKLNAGLNHYEFPSEEKEIDFFKRWKPRFTSELEFCKLIYHSLLFIPYQSGQKHRFWKREYMRLDTFTAEQKEFLDCYYNQRKDRDAFYFLRRFYKKEPLPETHAGGSDLLALTNGDPLAGTVVALERYKVYVEGRWLSEG